MRWIGIGRRELYPFFGLLFKTYQPFLLAISIDEFLRHYGAQPAFKRTSAHVEIQARDTAAVLLCGAVEVTVDGISQIAALRVFLGDAAGDVVQLLSVTD